MDRDELRAWLRLVLTPGVGPSLAQRLLAALGSPQAVWQAPEEALKDWLKPREVKAVRAEVPAAIEAQVALCERWLAEPSPEGCARTLITLADARYPASLLQEVADPPVLLWAMGRLNLLQAPSLAVVGSRHPTPQGQENARAFAQALSEAGLAVVSGLADGVDGLAHEGALAGPGSTIAVVATGLDRVYPAKHQNLAHRIAEQGLLISEFALGTPPMQINFPKRNRIVAGLTRGTLVVEAALQSGSLITARLASEMAREVFAIPGSIHAPQSRGCHALIKQGAKLVESSDDVLDELRWPRLAGPSVGLVQALGEAAEGVAGEVGSVSTDAEPDPLLAAMGYDPVNQDALQARTGMSTAELGARLLELEMMGRVARLPGLMFQRLGRA
jgi:DNA processing protein